MMKCLLVVIVLTILLCLSVSGQEIGDTDYWEQIPIGWDSTTMLMFEGVDGKVHTVWDIDTVYEWQRIPDRWTINKVDTVTKSSHCFDSLFFASRRDYHKHDNVYGEYYIKDNKHWKNYSAFVLYTLDTTFTPKQPLFLDSMQRERLEELLSKNINP